MKFIYIFVIVSTFLIACHSEKKELQKEIESLETWGNAVASTMPLDTLITAYQNYLTTFPNDAYASQYKNKAKKLLDNRLSELKKLTFNESTGVLNQEAMQEFIHWADQYATLLPDDPQTPEWLYQSAELAGSLNEYDKALSLFKIINEKYPNYEKASQVLFMRAFTLDSELKRFEEARPIYEEFLKKYPKDDFADDAQFLLENLGKSEEEIIRSFQEKQNR